MKVILSALIYLFLNTSFADEIRYYDVEIIIIENQSEQAKNSEHWPLAVNLNKPANTVVLGELPSREWLPLDADLEQSFKELNSDEYQLNAEVEKLSESKTQRVIFHGAWRQPGLDKSVAIPVYFKHEVSTVPLNQEQAPATDNIKNESNLSTLEGVFRVSLARYLHLEAELSYRAKVSEVSEVVSYDNSFYDVDNDANEDEIQKQGVIYLKQKRNRMRSNELHYLDHPVLGILVKMTPYIKTEEDIQVKPELN